MLKTSKNMFWIILLIVFMAMGDMSLWTQDAESGRRSSSRRSSSSSRSYSRSSSSWSSKSSSRASRSVWGSRSGGGIFGSKKSSSGYSKPFSKKSKSSSKTTSSVFSKPASKKKSSGYSKPGVKKTSFSGKSKFDKKKTQKLKKQKAAESLKAYKSETSKFKKTSKFSPQKSSKNLKSPIFKKTHKYGQYNYKSHYKNRDNYYKKHKWHRPRYAYLSRPSFGMWDAMVWWMILDNLNNRNYYAMAHHHANDPGFQEWKKEAERLAQDNDELKNKLNQLDQKVASMKGTARNPAYLPSDMPPEVAVAADAIASKQPDKPNLILATASKTGNYHFFGQQLKNHAAGLNVSLKNTAGSMENLKLLMSKKVDAAIVQSDAFEVYRQRFPNSKLLASEQTELYMEALQMIANVKSGIKTVKDIKPNGKHILYIGPNGSGTATTWLGLCNQDAEYKKIKIAYADYKTALKNVINNPNAIMMFVSGLNSITLKQAEVEAVRNKNIRLVEVNDWDFNDARDSFGNRIYKFVDIPREVYPGLQRGFITDRDIETIAVDAILVVNTDWAEKYGPESMELLSFAVMESQPIIARRVNSVN